MSLHLRCFKCDFLDVVLREKGKDWKCPNCEINQPERSKREDKTWHEKLTDSIDKAENEIMQDVLMRCSEHDGNAVRDK
jgi:phage FluMu protein Com